MQLYVLNPIHRLRALSRLWTRGSKRLQVTPTPAFSQDTANVETSEGKKLGSMAHGVVGEEEGLVEEQEIPSTGLKRSRSKVAKSRDSDYYFADEAGNGLCIFQAGDTLFRIHRCILMREPSVFRDMFSMPRPPMIAQDGELDEDPILISDDPDKFKDLLWAFYAPPSEFCLYRPTARGQAIRLDRLLNIAELANKYCVESYEHWAMERLYMAATQPNSFLAHGSAELCARVVDLAFACHHSQLLELATRQLTNRLIWTNTLDCCGPVCDIAERHGLRYLLGAALYRRMLAAPGQISFNSDGCRALPRVYSDNTIPNFANARRSFNSLWETLKATPPSVRSIKQNGHESCSVAWRRGWGDGVASKPVEGLDCADVLGRLKGVMHYCKRTLPATNTICVSCTMDALEAIGAARDEIIDGLLSHFEAGIWGDEVTL